MRIEYRERSYGKIKVKPHFEAYTMIRKFFGYLLRESISNMGGGLGNQKREKK